MDRWSGVVLIVVMAGCGDNQVAECYAPTMSSAEICDLLGDACDPVGDTLPAVSDLIVTAPSDDLPDEVVSQTSHNNLDIAWHEGRLYFAFRTAPTHFASDETVLYVVSTTDQKTWTFEAEFNFHTDLREPRLLSYNGQLIMHFAVLGYNPFAFEPQATMMTQQIGPCQWSEPVEVFEPGFIPWRTKVVDGVPYLLGYVGGENIYEADGEPLRVSFLTSDDGIDWTPVTGDGVVLEGGNSETDFAFAGDGTLVAVSRNEAGDGEHWGSKICRAEPNDLGNWTCADDPKKYDSPLVFGHNGDVYLIGRRNVTETGEYDLHLDDLPPGEQTTKYNAAYWTKPKRCALWKVDGQSLTVEHMLDLPSNGDTCFPGLLELGDGRFLVYNYTSPLDDPDLAWVEGQTGDTFIYRLTLELP